MQWNHTHPHREHSISHTPHKHDPSHPSSIESEALPIHTGGRSTDPTRSTHRIQRSSVTGQLSTAYLTTLLPLQSGKGIACRKGTPSDGELLFATGIPLSLFNCSGRRVYPCLALAQSRGGTGGGVDLPGLSSFLVTLAFFHTHILTSLTSIWSKRRALPALGHAAGVHVSVQVNNTAALVARSATAHSDLSALDLEGIILKEANRQDVAPGTSLDRGEL